MLALSSRPWAVHCHQFALTTTPLAYSTLEYGSSFVSEHCLEGIVAITGNTLRILSLDKLEDSFNAETIPLRYTPRRVASHSISGNLVVVEADHNAYNEEEKAQLYEAVGISPPMPADAAAPEEEETDEAVVMEASIGVPRAQPGKWASCIRVVDPITRETLSVIELGDNEVRLHILPV